MSIDNPAFISALRLEIVIRVSPTLNYYKESKDFIEIPVGATAEVLNILGDGFGVDDRRNETKLEIDYNTNFVLRNYQADSLKALGDKTVGVIEAPTGTGKTYIMLELIKQKQQNTLILVDTYELVEQFKKRLKELTTVCNIGFVGGGERNWQPVTVCLLQTMRNLSEEELKYVNANFGMVLCDEVHIVAANTYYETLSRLNVKYKFGFSATPFRGDGLTDVIFWTTGPKIYIVTNTETKEHTIQPTLEVVKTKFTWDLIQNTDYSFMVNDLSVDKARNSLITHHYRSEPKHFEMQTVFLCTLRTQIYLLWDALGRDGGVLISTLSKEAKLKMYKEAKISEEDLKIFNSFSSKKNRKAVIEGLRSGEINKVFTTYALFNKGIDIDTLELMYFCGPTRSITRIPQSKGRLVRKRLDGKPKDPKIVHMFDERVSLLKYQGYATQRILRKSSKV